MPRIFGIHLFDIYLLDIYLSRIVFGIFICASMMSHAFARTPFDYVAIDMNIVHSLNHYIHKAAHLHYGPQSLLVTDSHQSHSYYQSKDFLLKAFRAIAARDMKNFCGPKIMTLQQMSLMRLITSDLIENAMRSHYIFQPQFFYLGEFSGDYHQNIELDQRWDLMMNYAIDRQQYAAWALWLKWVGQGKIALDETAFYEEIENFFIYIHCYLINDYPHSSDQSHHDLKQFPDSFIWGVASAPAHVEDILEDSWIDWANRGYVRSYFQHQSPDDRLMFWSQPHLEAEWLKKLGVNSYRMGVDWGRIHPSSNKPFSEKVLLRYKSIIQEEFHRNGISVMLTLFHHSLPKWAIEQGGWTSLEVTEQFLLFAKYIIKYLQSDITSIVTFNEPVVFSLLTTVDVIWPSHYPAYKKRPWNLLYSPVPWLPQGAYHKSLKNMAYAHNTLYQWIKDHYPHIQVGIAKHFGIHKGASLTQKKIAKVSHEFFNFSFFEQLIKSYHLLDNNQRLFPWDFVGVNYYGAEWISLSGPQVLSSINYSEAGRAVFPQGLFQIIDEFTQRYGQHPFIITENGIADRDDILRPKYLVDHLLVLHDLIKKGFDIRGYYHWTLTDNFEWSDGYCPRFGLLDVNRENQMRYPRPSFYLYQNIIMNNGVSQKQVNWSQQRRNMGKDFMKMQSMCRKGKSPSRGLDVPWARAYPN